MSSDTENRISDNYTVKRIVRFTVDQLPQGKRSVKAAIRGGKVHTYQDDKTRAYEADVAFFAKIAMGSKPLLEGPLKLTVGIYFAIPESAPKKFHEAMCAGLILPLKRPDCSNVIKSIEDGMNGVVFKDDCQVVSLTAFKMYSLKPRVDVCVSVWDAKVDTFAVPVR